MALLPLDIDMVWLADHGGGYRADFGNDQLDLLKSAGTVITDEVICDSVRQRYPHLRFQFYAPMKVQLLDKLKDHVITDTPSHSNFVCCFNGSEHVSRRLLVAAMHKFGWWNLQTCTKNFVFDVDTLDGHLQDLSENERRDRKFFIGESSAEFFAQLYSLDYRRYDHKSNIDVLQPAITNSFVNIVSESMATSYQPHITEKFLYSVVTKGLFVAYAQPAWHDHLERYYGFRRFDRIFNYRFDLIQNPIERLIELLSMLAKFSALSSDDWRDLYRIESDTVEFNYDHYRSGRYQTRLDQNMYK